MWLLKFLFVAVSNIFCCLRKQTNELKQIGKEMYHVHSEAVDMTKECLESKANWKSLP
jgi:hypothetical protein